MALAEQNPNEPTEPIPLDWSPDAPRGGKAVVVRLYPLSILTRRLSVRTPVWTRTWSRWSLCSVMRCSSPTRPSTRSPAGCAAMPGGAGRRAPGPARRARRPRGRLSAPVQRASSTPAAACGRGAASDRAEGRGVYNDLLVLARKKGFGL